MKRITNAVAVGLLCLALSPAPTGAYEATTTHAGLTEQAASHSSLHSRLVDQLGYQRGLFEPLIVPQPDAQSLYTVLRRFNPTHGFVPDGRGQLSALGWLVAGAVIADSPDVHWANHFFDPATGRGLSDATLRGLDTSLRVRIEQQLAGDRVPRSGKPAPAWITDPDNPMNLAGFLEQYEKAVRARTGGERERHMAGALLAAGAILHVLQDMGSPSHVRNDMAAHLERIGEDRLDVGSRFERVAALAYGRLGVPGPAGTVKRPDLRSFFTAEDGKGLADTTSRGYLSAGTMPRSFELRGRVSSEAMARLIQRSLRRPAPAPLPRLDLFGAARGPVALTDGAGTCLARYQLTRGRLTWSTDDRCRLEQLAALLPRVSAYSTGLLDYLFRGALTVAAEGDRITVTASGTGHKAGTLEMFWDDERGVRTKYHELEVQGAARGKALARAPRPPEGAIRVVALFKGAGAGDQPLVATGQTSF